jgi:CubicO group peptidase (beta-lactamase class C family)
MLCVVIEKLSGQGCFRYISDKIYNPAGMIHSNGYELVQLIAYLAIENKYYKF